jgi:hypothetical protein
MTQLPATLDYEAELFAFAREWIAPFREEGNFMDLGFAPLHPECGLAFARRIIKQYALMHPFNMDDIVKKAQAGWDEADLALRELIAEHVDRGKALPSILAAYNVQLLNPRGAPPAKPRGQKKASNIMRDIVITTLIMELIERFPASGLKPTRYQLGRKRQHSACSIVAIVLAEAGLYRKGEETIQKIWKHYAPAVLPGTVAEALLLLP